MVKQIKVRTKMLASFSLLVLFTVTVGFMGIRGIKQINYQNEIGSLATDILVDAQDVQAGSLRYMIYLDQKYMTEASQEVTNVLESAVAIENLMLREENKVYLEELQGAIGEYYDLMVDFQSTQNKINTANAVQESSSQKVLEDVNKIIDKAQGILTRSSRSGMVPYSQISRLGQLQEIRNAVNRFRGYAQKYQLALTDKKKNEYTGLWDKEISATEEMILAVESQFSDPEIQTLFTDSLEKLEVYRQNAKNFRSQVKKQEVIRGSQRSKADITMRNARRVRAGVEEVISGVTKSNQLLTLILALVSAGVGLVIAVILTRSITTQLGGEPYEIVDVTSRVAAGNLNISFPDRKLTGVYAAMKDMTLQITTIVNDIISAADQVNSGSEQISSSAQQISSGTSEQASNMEEVSASIEELNANIEQNADNAQQSNVMAKRVTEDSQAGSVAVAETVDAMQAIAEKISVIQEIARNTNMLALNAAIEAARAGDAGRGFAVVAQEVRKLAESSGAAAKEITEITGNSVQRALAAQEKIEQIIPTMRKTADLVEEISMASQEQSKGSLQINSAITQLDSVVQQNASASEELASMSEELLSQAMTMKDTIGFFKLSGSEVLDIDYKVESRKDQTDEGDSEDEAPRQIESETELAQFESVGDEEEELDPEKDFEEY